MSEGSKSPVERHRHQLQWWRTQAAQVERDRHQLRWVWRVGAALATPMALWRPLWGIGLFALSGLVWGMGVYLTTVRRYEFANNMRETEIDLEAALRASANASEGLDSPACKPSRPVPPSHRPPGPCA